ncbi:two-component sensor histidine kinase [Pseudolysinimonas kribbensis]|uniref:histidine kinase n=1 Tax=Pseudolysinimonas kribbensis TaxID=433641 RepID=A0ABQ6K6G7_9MICO|nr:HAMP domain-containing sensor histidine kinase [Pseudolysinimonas kribbensis]GMA94630.1 two-component sensor histidine kinase [Pseudolysinimonas kribbensis]
MLRRRTLTLQLQVVSAAGVVAMVAGIATVSLAMYLSSHDLLVSLWVSGVAAVVSLAMATGLGVVLRRSAGRLRTAVRAVGDGELVPVASSSGSELSALAAELTSTSERLASAREEIARIDASRRELMAWISHDLRTPLAGLRAMSEALEDGVARDPANYYRQMRDQVDRLSALVDDLFELSQIQAGVLRVAAAPVPLRALLTQAAAELAPIGLPRGIRIEVDADDAEIVADARLLSRVIANLVVNAVQHSPDDSVVRVTARRRDDGRAHLTVQDTAGGIAAEQLERIFDAGWRGDPSRTPEPLVGRSAGAGLGLAIARGIVSAHDGRIEASNVAGGSRFDIHLPSRAIGEPAGA